MAHARHITWVNFSTFGAKEKHEHEGTEERDTEGVGGQGGCVGGQRRPCSLRSRHESFPLGRTGSVSCRQPPLPVQNPPQIQPLSTLVQALSGRGHHRPFQVLKVILAAIPSGCGRRNAITYQNVIEGSGRPTSGCNVAGAVSGQSLPSSPPSLSDQVRSSAGRPPNLLPADRPPPRRRPR